MKKIIFIITGGLGKTIAATAVCKAIKKQKPDHQLIVVSGYPDVFLGNPNVYRSYAYGQTAYFYSEHVEGQKPIVLAHDPYMSESFIHQDENLIKTWIEMFGLKYDNEQPELFLTEREVQFNANRFASEKPIMAIQTNGGAEQQQNKYSWMRDIPSIVAVKVIEHFKEKYNIVHIRRQDQQAYQNTIPVSDTFRALTVLISMSSKRLFMDSFAQHTAAALQLPSTVLWIGNKPEVFGYATHDNIKSNAFTRTPELRNSFLHQFDWTGGDATQFPYNSESEIFDADEIIASLEKEA